MAGKKEKLKVLPPRLNLVGKTVLLRGGIDVPLAKHKDSYRVTDDTRLRQVAITIDELTRRGAKVVLMGHLGRPKGRVKTALRSRPVADELSELCGTTTKSITSVTHWHFPRLRNVIAGLNSGDVLLLENLRFHPGETTNDEAFAKELASLADVYVNEAFSNSHRLHASMVGVTKFLPSYAGAQLAREIKTLDAVRSKPKKPLVVVIGGGKVEDKLDMIIALAPKASAILVGGVPANTILAHRKLSMGSSRVGEGLPAKLKPLLKIKRRFPGVGLAPLIQTPHDLVVAEGPDGHPRVVSIDDKKGLAKDEGAFDVGPATVQHFARFVKKAATIVWDGPMGLIEVGPYRHGSVALGRLIAARSSGRAFGVVGGGDSLEVLNDTGMAEYVDYRSTGGGAMLTLLAGKPLPAVEVLK